MPTLRLVCIDEAHELDAEAVPSLVELARQLDGRAARADDQQALGGPEARSTATRRASRQTTIDVTMSTPAMSTMPRPMGQRRGPSSKRTARISEAAPSAWSRPMTRSRRLCGAARVIEIAVVQRELQDDRDRASARQMRCHESDASASCSRPRRSTHGAEHARHDEQVVDDDQRQAAPGDAVKRARMGPCRVTTLRRSPAGRAVVLRAAAASSWSALGAVQHDAQDASRVRTLRPP